MEDADADAAAMAEAMGFSSFGNQASNKRRKFNPSTDAFVASMSPSDPTSDSGPHFADSHITTTGSNMVPLGIRKKNLNEIDLEDDEDEERLPPGSRDNQESRRDITDDDDPEPQYLDTSRPSAPIIADPVDRLQSTIDAIVGSSGDACVPPQLSSSVVAGGQPNRGSHGGPQRRS